MNALVTEATSDDTEVVVQVRNVVLKVLEDGEHKERTPIVRGRSGIWCLEGRMRERSKRRSCLSTLRLSAFRQHVTRRS